MALTRTCTLNGNVLWPDSISGGKKRIGVEIESANGSYSYLHRGVKGEWTLTWDRPKSAVVEAILGFYFTVISYTFVIDGETFTVSFKPDRELERTFPLAGSIEGTRYRIAVTLREL